MPLIIPAIAKHQTSDRITAVIVGKLCRAGIENPEQYLKRVEYIFLPRYEDERITAYDVVVVRLPPARHPIPPPARHPIPKQKLPPYIAHAIAKAIRESFFKDDDSDTIHTVHFALYRLLSKRFLIVHTDAPSPPPPGLNYCRQFERDIIYPYDGLRFRSWGEIAIYKELRQRNVLFLPNALAVLGTTGTEYGEKVKRLEPDFLVFYKGKCGILEVNGDAFHSGPIKTAEDHDRARKFQKYGLYFIQAYSADRCKEKPMDVVDEFLMLLEKHK